MYVYMQSSLLQKLLKVPICLLLTSSTDTRFRTPLHLAARKGNIECVKKLLRYKHAFEISAKDETNKTALHLATLRGHYE